MNYKQHGVIQGDMIGILIGAVALGGLLLYGLISGQPLPVWPAVAVILVNVIAAGNVFWNVRKAKRLHQAKLLSDTKVPH